LVSHKSLVTRRTIVALILSFDRNYYGGMHVGMNVNIRDFEKTWLLRSSRALRWTSACSLGPSGCRKGFRDRL
jgi:fumarylacetoacetate (FAA) hydrolase family protein